MFFSSTTILAKGGSLGGNGSGTSPGSGSNGGQASSGFGSTKWNGGYGQPGRDNNTGRGGYGGSSAGITQAGIETTVFEWTTATAPTTNPVGSGVGGDGAAVTSGPGSAPASGNGGGGGGSSEGTANSGGSGAVGKVVITPIDSIGISVGKNGQAIYFPSTSNSYISVGNTSASVKSVAFWLKVATSTSVQSIMDLNGTATIDILSSAVRANNFTGATIYIDGAQTAVLNDTNWHYVVITATSAVTASAFDIGRISATYLGGTLDDIRFYGNTLSASEVSKLYDSLHSYRASVTNTAKASDANTSLATGLVGHWTFDGKDMYQNVVDSSGNGNTGYLSGFTSTTTVSGKIGQALNFDGVDDRIDLTDSSVFDVGGAGAWCLWFYPTANQSSRSMFSQDVSSGASATTYKWIGAYLDTNSTNLYSFVRIAGVAYSANFISPDGSYRNAWHHVCSTFDRTLSSARLKIYIDGVFRDSDTAADGDIDVGDYPQIGKRAGASALFNGKIDDVRLYNRALSAAEILQLYNNTKGAKVNVTNTAKASDANTSLATGLVGHWTFDGKDMYQNVVDSSGNGNTGYLSGFTSTTTVPGKIGQALTFDGVNDYVNAGTGITWSADQTKSVSVWLKTSTVSKTFVNQARTADSAGVIYLFIDATSHLESWLNDSGFDFGGKLTDNAWHHVVWVYDGSAETAYMDGSQLGGSNTENASASSGKTLFIGQYLGAAEQFNGSLDDVRIYNRALSAAEILQLYTLGR